MLLYSHLQCVYYTVVPYGNLANPWQSAEGTSMSLLCYAMVNGGLHAGLRNNIE